MSWLLKEVKELNCTVAAAFNCDLSPVTERVNYAINKDCFYQRNNRQLMLNFNYIVFHLN